MPTVDLPGMRSISTDSACIARHRSSARPVIFEYFTPASGLNSKVVTTGPGMNLDDRAFDRELAALLLEQPRAVHQLALVDLALGLRRVEQRERRQRVLALAALGRRLRRRLGIGQRQRRRRHGDLRRLRRRERLRAAERPARRRGGRRPSASSRRVALRRGCGGAPRDCGGRRRRRRLDRPAAAPPFFVCLAITSRRCFSRRRSSRHSRNGVERRARAAVDRGDERARRSGRTRTAST